MFRSARPITRRRRFFLSSDDGVTLALDGAAFTVPALLRQSLEPWLRDVLQ
jgi:hypothetical protein